MDRVGYFLSVLDIALQTKSKRHIIGGVLLSASLLLGGMAFTVITLKTEDKENDGRFIEQ